MSILIYILLTPPCLLALLICPLMMTFALLVRLIAPKGTVAERWAINVFVGFDQLLNVACGGDPDETFSGHAGRMLRDEMGPPWMRWLLRRVCAFLTLLDRKNREKGHCETYASPPGEYRNGLLTYRRTRRKLLQSETH